ncbi:hypothetical protein C4D60_Mb01t03560 [Musa balbisiana]|uniref:Uncharacterized protein n=1 Tax=Musa balbisiana TaxID=52838 RepID=A0A4S8JKW7_MUSBA|nr:hypothetical protein C4D60_Mb01t03560 [Musa balbisiana]
MRNGAAASPLQPPHSSALLLPATHSIATTADPALTDRSILGPLLPFARLDHGMAERVTTPTHRGHSRGSSQTEPQGSSTPESTNKPGDLLTQYQQELDKLRAKTHEGLPFGEMGLSERRLGAIQKEAARQACEALQQFRDIHSVKTEEYQRRSGGKDNWYKDWLPVVLKQQQQLEKALSLAKDVSQRTTSFSL